SMTWRWTLLHSNIAQAKGGTEFQSHVVFPAPSINFCNVSNIDQHLSLRSGIIGLSPLVIRLPSVTESSVTLPPDRREAS
ncbi:MAG TPA: hypothetical protein VIL63_01145, partial [Terriglobales bacterium]